MKIIKVNLKQNPYNIYIDYNLFKKIPLYIEKLNLGNKGIILTSKNIYFLYKKTIEENFGKKNYKTLILPDGEKIKSLFWFLRTVKDILKLDGWNKKIFIICLGGGTIGDLGGFIASVYKRGIPYIQVPTTLLSQIDSSIGGKTALNLKEAKNIIGTFYQPKAVFIDPLFLNTLSQKLIIEGIAEVIKYGVIKDENFFNFLRKKTSEILNLNPKFITKVISESVKIKTKIIEKDENEKKGIRTILNFGHTFAHAIEASLNYKKISHGEAVAIGMILEAKFSLFLGFCEKNEVDKIKEIIKIFNFPTLPSIVNLNLYKTMAYDKKFIEGRPRMVLLEKIGKVKVVEEISLKILKKFLKFSLPNLTN